MTVDLTKANADEILRLNEWQTAGQVHPFTCPNRSDGLHREFNGDLGAPLERYFHELFSQDRERGEWFKFSDHIRCFLNARPYEPPPPPPKPEGERVWRL